MRQVGTLVLVAALVLASGAQAAPPDIGVLVPGRSLAGVSPGMTPAAVLRLWGRRHGVCRGCAHTTWYFNRKPFAPEGAGVEFRGGRAAAAFTLWKPSGWRTREGVVLGETVARITEVYGPLTRTECGTYYALSLSLPRDGAVTVFYVSDGQLWGFGLMRPDVARCR